MTLVLNFSWLSPLHLKSRSLLSNSLTFFILFLLDIGLRSVLQHIDIFWVWLEDLTTHWDSSACLLTLVMTQGKHIAMLYCLMWTNTVLILLMAGDSRLTCASAWQMRSLARTVKCCTLGSVFITASYLLTASSYLKEQEGGRCFYNISLSIQHNAAQIIAPTKIIPLMSCALFSLVNVNVMWHAFKSMRFAWLFVKPESHSAGGRGTVIVQLMQYMAFIGDIVWFTTTGTHTYTHALTSVLGWIPLQTGSVC